MADSSPPWDAYCAIMACRLVALDKRQGGLPVGIRETLCQDLAKLVMRAAGYQAKMVCANLQLCAGLEAGIEGATHAVGQQILERSSARRNKDEARSSDKEEETESVVAVFDNLNMETVVREEEATEGLKAVLGMDIEEEGELDGEVEEGGDGTKRAL